MLHENAVPVVDSLVKQTAYLVPFRDRLLHFNIHHFESEKPGPYPREPGFLMRTSGDD